MTGHIIYFIVDSQLWKSFQTVVSLEKMSLQAMQTHSVPRWTSVWVMEISQLSKLRGSVGQVFFPSLANQAGKWIPVG